MARWQEKDGWWMWIASQLSGFGSVKRVKRVCLRRLGEGGRELQLVAWSYAVASNLGGRVGCWCGRNWHARLAAGRGSMQVQATGPWAQYGPADTQQGCKVGDPGATQGSKRLPQPLNQGRPGPIFRDAVVKTGQGRSRKEAAVSYCHRHASAATLQPACHPVRSTLTTPFHQGKPSFLSATNAAHCLLLENPQ